MIRQTKRRECFGIGVMYGQVRENKIQDSIFPRRNFNNLLKMVVVLYELQIQTVEVPTDH